MHRFLNAFLLMCLTGATDPGLAADGSVSLQRYEFQRVEMGVEFRVSVYASNPSIANKAVTEAFDCVHELNGIMSDYDADSELRRLCDRAVPGEPVPVSADLFRVLQYADEMSRQSNGAFDVTVGPLTKLWRRTRRQKVLPEKEELAEALSVVGYEKVKLCPADRTVALQKTGMRLDLGGIAQGYAADEMLKVLAKHGLTRSLIDASGDVLAGDPPPGQRGWRVAVADPDPEKKTAVAVLEIAHRSVSTSGDAFQFVEIDGRRYSHIVDPATGFGLTHRSSVTVIADTGMEADCLATAVCILGEEAGLKLAAKRCGVEVLMMTGNDFGTGKARVIRSAGFNQFLARPD